MSPSGSEHIPLSGFTLLFGIFMVRISRYPVCTSALRWVRNCSAVSRDRMPGKSCFRQLIPGINAETEPLMCPPHDWVLLQYHELQRTFHVVLTSAYQVSLFHSEPREILQEARHQHTILKPWAQEREPHSGHHCQWKQPPPGSKEPPLCVSTVIVPDLIVCQETIPDSV